MRTRLYIILLFFYFHNALPQGSSYFENYQNKVRQSVNEVNILRTDLSKKYNTYFPTHIDLFQIMNLAKAIAGSTSKQDQYNFIYTVENLGYRLEDPARKLYSDLNQFKNNRGYEIYTVRIVDKYGRLKAISANLKIKNAPKDIIELYVKEITSNCRKNTSSMLDPFKSGQKLDSEPVHYVISGGTIYLYEIKNGTLKVTALDNSDAKAVVIAEHIAPNKLKVTPWSNFTNISLKKGAVLELKTSGTIALGNFIRLVHGKTGPEGIDGYQQYNIDRRFNHGCLLGKIGKGEWFLVGNGKRIVAENEGFLQLKINDNKVNDNDGYFVVEYARD